MNPVRNIKGSFNKKLYLRWRISNGVNLSSKKVIKDLLKKHQTHPSRRLGQNFLIDKRVIKKFIEAADLGPGDVVLEIGPGIGTITQEVARKTGIVIAIEKDPKMVEILKETVGNLKSVEIIRGDVLKIENLKATLRGVCPKANRKVENYKVVANLPYYITAPVIRKFLESKIQPKLMVLMVQKEVAQRMCPPRRARSSGETGATPPRMSLLAVSVQFYARPEIISYVSKKSFWPSPKVDSAIIKIVPYNGRETVPVPLFFRIVRAGFSHPRKQILNNLSTMLKLNKDEVKSWLLKNNIHPTQRAETLSIEDWTNLTKIFKI